MYDQKDLVTLEQFLEFQPDDRVRAMLEFWSDARGSAAFPSYTDIDLMTVPRLAPETFVIDSLGDGDFRYRFMGSKIDALVGGSFTGKKFSEARHGRVLEEISSFFGTVVSNGLIGVLTTSLPSETSAYRTYVRTGFPLADDHVSPNKVLGMIFPVGETRTVEQTYSSYWADVDERGNADRRFVRI